MAKRFFYVSAALLMLAATYHIGARSAQAQAGATGFGFTAYGYGLFVGLPGILWLKTLS